MIKQEVPFGQMSTKANFVFCFFFARKCNPYQGYELNDIPEVNLVLLQMRWDGLLGACGGTVESTDLSLQDACHREVLEEMNYSLDTEKLKPLKSLEFYSGSISHSYSYEVSYDELKEIRNNYVNAKHASAEVAGVNLCHISRYSKGQNKEAGYNCLMTQSFVGSAKYELECLVETENLLISYLGD